MSFCVRETTKDSKKKTYHYKANKTIKNSIKVKVDKRFNGGDPDFLDDLLIDIYDKVTKWKGNSIPLKDYIQDVTFEKINEHIESKYWNKYVQNVGENKYEFITYVIEESKKFVVFTKTTKYEIKLVEETVKEVNKKQVFTAYKFEVTKHGGETKVITFFHDNTFMVVSSTIYNDGTS